MIQKTTEYNKFIFREDNREKIDQGHVNKLINSITARNMLELKPILVNEKMEVIDGQHRLLAAQKLGVPIFYQIEKSLDSGEMMLMNICKTWTVGDIFNYYLKNDYEQYKKLSQFMKQNNLTLLIALNILGGRKHKFYEDFKLGNFMFDSEIYAADLTICWETINYIQAINRNSKFIESARFWKALLKLVRNKDFNPDKWMKNVGLLVHRFTILATSNDYLKLFYQIYNYKNKERLEE